MEDPGATAQDHVVLAAKVVGKAGARIKFSFGTVQHVGRKSFKLIAQAIVQIQISSDLPGMLKIETAIIMRRLTFRLISHRVGNSLSLEYRRVEAWLGEVGRQEAFKEEHLRCAGLQAEWALDRQQASEVGFKGIKQRERFERIHVAEVAAESDGVLTMLPGYVVHNLCTALLVEIRIATVHARSEGVEHLQVWLSGDSGEVERAVAVLQAQFIHQVRRES